jgi:hypothetical protein
MDKTVQRTGVSEMPTNEKSHTAAPPLTTTSNIKMVGTIETNKYIEKIIGIA